MKIKKFLLFVSLFACRNSAFSYARRSARKRAETRRHLEIINDELEFRLLMATFSYNSGSGLLTIQTDVNNEQLSIISTSESGNYTITTSGLWSGSAITGLATSGTNLFVNQPVGLASILVNDNSGAYTGSTFSFGASSANFVNNLTVNYAGTSGQISVGNAASFINSSSLSLAGRNIHVEGNVTTTSGEIALYGNGGGAYQTGSFNGIEIGNEAGNNINVITGGGNIVMDGRGAADSGYSGVYVNRACVSAGGGGNVNITGISANGTDYCYGVKSYSSRITVADGTLRIDGTSSGSASTAIGACIESSPTIAATGTGNIIITGTTLGGTTDVSGIYVTDTPITTTSGLIRFNGTSYATGTGSSGVLLGYNANFSATNFGNIDLSGSTPGCISDGIGINVFDSSALIFNNGGLISLTANTINLIGTVNATSAGTVLIQTLGAVVNLGDGTDTASNLGLSQAEINSVTAGTLIIGNSSTGAIVNTAPINFTGNLSLVSGSTIAQSGGNLTVFGTASFVAIGNSITLNNTTNDFNILLANGGAVTVNEINNLTLGSIIATGGLTVIGCTTTSCISVTGPINATGGSGGVSLTGRNIQVTGNISTATGDISLYGNGGGVYQSGSFDGVNISGSTVNVNTTSGNIRMNGRGSSDPRDGVDIKGAKVKAGGSGCVSITGVSGNSGSDTRGIYLDSTGACITTINGSISLNGTSCGTTTSGRGVLLDQNSRIALTGSGNITIIGLVACGTDNTIAIRANVSCVTTTSGTLTINGTSCATGCNPIGIYALSSNISATGSGNLNIVGTTIGGTDDSYGVLISRP